MIGGALYVRVTLQGLARLCISLTSHLATFCTFADDWAHVDQVTDSSDRRPKAVALSYCIGHRISWSYLSYVIAFMSSQSAWRLQ